MTKSLLVAFAGFAVVACSSADPVEQPAEEPVAETTSAAKTCRPEKKYVSRKQSTCATIRFLCEEGREPFFDATGCGCRCAAPVVNTCDDPARTYVSRDPGACETIRFYCASGTAFFDDCGCGCIN